MSERYRLKMNMKKSKFIVIKEEKRERKKLKFIYTPTRFQS